MPTAPAKPDVIRMSVLDEDWKSVRIAALNKGLPAQDHAGDPLAAVAGRGDLLSKDDWASYTSSPAPRRRAVWIAVPDHAASKLNEMRQQRGVSWARLLHLTLWQVAATVSA